jgi:hypothetical protein
MTDRRYLSLVICLAALVVLPGLMPAAAQTPMSVNRDNAAGDMFVSSRFCAEISSFSSLIGNGPGGTLTNPRVLTDSHSVHNAHDLNRATGCSRSPGIGFSVPSVVAETLRLIDLPPPCVALA